MGQVRELEPLVAGRPFELDGRTYEAEEVVDVSSLPDHKIEQLLRTRVLKPQRVVEGDSKL